MADEPKPHHPIQDAVLFFGFLILLAVIWVAQGANGADLRGIFLHSPTQGGGAYGPAPGNVSTSSPGVHFEYTY